MKYEVEWKFETDPIVEILFNWTFIEIEGYVVFIVLTIIIPSDFGSHPIFNHNLHCFFSSKSGRLICAKEAQVKPQKFMQSSDKKLLFYRFMVSIEMYLLGGKLGKRVFVIKDTSHTKMRKKKIAEEQGKKDKRDKIKWVN